MRKAFVLLAFLLSVSFPIVGHAEIRPVSITDIFDFPGKLNILKKPYSQEILATSTYSGAQIVEVELPSPQTKATVFVVADPKLIQESRGLSILVERILEDGEIVPFGSSDSPDVLTGLTSLHEKNRFHQAISFSIQEQILREDVVPENWYRYRQILTENDTYYQMAFNKLRVTVRSYDPHTGEDADLTYSATIVTEDKKPAGLPSGHHSASLIQTFPAAENAGGVAVTTTGITTTSGSLIVGLGGSWNTGGGQNNTISDSKSNSFTEQIDLQFGPSNGGRLTISYNTGGTRGASHTITNTKTGADTFVTVGGGEFSGVALSPTVVSNTATGVFTSPSTNPPSVSVTAGASSLFVGITGYDGAGGLTITENTGGGWALIVEADENNDAQAFNSQYKAGITGAQTASWTLSATVNWGAGIVAFTEGASNLVPIIKGRGGLLLRGKVKFR